MKALFFVSTLLVLLSCGSDDSSTPPPVVTTPPITVQDNYTYQIIEMQRNYSGQYFQSCTSDVPLTFNNIQELCASILDKYQNGRCSQNCARDASIKFNCGHNLPINQQQSTACQNLTDYYQTQTRSF